MNKRKINIGLIGSGNIGRTHAQALQKFRDRVNVYTCDRDISKAIALKENFQLEGVFPTYQDVIASDEIDAVEICTPHHLHAPITIAAAEAGKHILCEKPMAASLDEADQMINETNKSGVLLAVSENFRYEPAGPIIKDLLDKQVIGKPFLVVINELWFMNPVIKEIPAYDWRRKNAECGGGVLFDRGIHLAAFLNSIFGKPETVFAKTTSPDSTFEVDDTSVLIMKFNNGVIANWVETWMAPNPPRVPLISIYGTEGSITEVPEKRIPPHMKFEIGGLSVYSINNQKYYLEPTSEEISASQRWMNDIWDKGPSCEALKISLGHGVLIDLDKQFPTYNVYEKSIENFLDSIEGKTTPRVSGDIAKDDMDVIFNAYKSSQTGQELKLQ